MPICYLRFKVLLSIVVSEREEGYFVIFCFQQKEMVLSNSNDSPWDFFSILFGVVDLEGKCTRKNNIRCISFETGVQVPTVAIFIRVSER